MKKSISKGRSYVLAKSRVLTITYSYYQSNTVVPNIRIMGKWLEELGFTIGEKVEIYQERPDEIVIRKVPSKN